MIIKEKKRALIIGAGLWGQKLIRFLVSLGYSIEYATRDNNKNEVLEKEFKDKEVKLFENNTKLFDLLIIAVRPNDIYAAWKEYNYLSKSILIEKPGPSKLNQLLEIIEHSNQKKIKLLFNYEYYYTETSICMREILKKNFNYINHIKLLWEKPKTENGGLEWRLLPHLLSELLIEVNYKIDLLNSNLTSDTFMIEGKVNKKLFNLRTGYSTTTINQIVVKMKNNDIYIKDMNKLKMNNTIIMENKSSSLKNIINIFSNSNDDIYTDNNNIAISVTKILSELNF